MVFNFLYSGAISIEADTEEEALQIWDSKYWDLGEIDEIKIDESEVD